MSAPSDGAAGPTLRERHREQTQELLVEAAAEVLRDVGVEGFTVDRVAERAGVGTRTVYRHFKERDDLMQAAGDRLDTEFPYRTPRDAGQIAEVFERLVASCEEQPELVRSAVISRLSGKTRWRGRSRRVEEIHAALDEVTASLSPADARRSKAIISYLASSVAWLLLTEEEGLDARDAGRAVGWAIRTLVADLRAEGEKPKGRRK